MGSYDNSGAARSEGFVKREIGVRQHAGALSRGALIGGELDVSVREISSL